MIEFDLSFDKSKYDALMKKVGLLANEKEINKALNRAAKRAADAGKTEAVRQIRGEYTLPSALVRKGITARYIGAGSVGAVLHLSSSPFPLPKFTGVTPSNTMPPEIGPVKAKVKKSGGSTLKRAFIARMKSGHVGSFERNQDGVKTGTGRVKLEQHFGPTIPGMLGREDETPRNQAVREKIMETLDKRVVHELERLLNG